MSLERSAGDGRINRSGVLAKVRDSTEAVSRLDGSPIVRVGVIGFELSEIEGRLEKTIASKLRGPGYMAGVLLIYSEGPLFLFDVPKTVIRLKEIAEVCQVQQSFLEIWFLTHYWTADQNLYRVV